MASHPSPRPHAHYFWKDLFKKGTADERTVLDVLRENMLFKSLGKRDLGYLANFVYERAYQEEEAVFRQGERGIGMYVIAKGRIAIRTQSPQGELTVTTLGPGSFFGEIALVEENSVRTASAIPLEKSLVIGFFKPDLEEILSRKPDVGVKILFQLATVLARRLVETTDKITAISRPHEVKPQEVAEDDQRQAV